MSSYPSESLAISDLLWAKTGEIQTIHFISQSTLELLLFRVRCCEYSPDLMDIITWPSGVLDSDRLIVTFCDFESQKEKSIHVIWKIKTFIEEDIRYKKHASVLFKGDFSFRKSQRSQTAKFELEAKSPVDLMFCQKNIKKKNLKSIITFSYWTLHYVLFFQIYLHRIVYRILAIIIILILVCL